MGIELELSVLLIMSVVGQSIFSRFALEVPAWRQILKWLVLTGITLGLYAVAGHWALFLPVVLVAALLPAHFTWCRRNGIDPLRATPARKYYELRGWTWPEEKLEKNG
jgi:hypothetical protein